MHALPLTLLNNNDNDLKQYKNEMDRIHTKKTNKL